MSNKNISTKKGFTLLELLIVIGILAILSVSVIVILNPAEYLKASRDTKRAVEVDALNKVIQMIELQNPALNQAVENVAYISLPSSDPNCSSYSYLPPLPAGFTNYACKNASSRKVDGTGWIPINLTNAALGASVSSLSIDPRNISNGSTNEHFFYIYAKGYGVSAFAFESKKYLGEEAVVRENCIGHMNCYQSLSFWENAVQRDLVASNEIATVRIEGIWNNPDIYPLAIDGWTTGPNNYIQIYTVSEARHNGAWDNTKYRLEVSDIYGTYASLLIKNSYTRIDGLQVNVKLTSGYNAHGISISPDIPITDVRISNNIIKYTGSNNTSFNGITDGCSGCIINTNDKIWNNIVYGFNQGISFAGVTNVAYNNTVSNCHTSSAYRYGIVSADYDNRPIVKNNIVQNCSGAGYNGAFNVASVYNLSHLSDAPGANPENSTAVSFVDSFNENFHLSADTLPGTNLSADPFLPFDSDIDERARSGSWSKGADEYNN